MDQIETILQSVRNTLTPIMGIAGVVLGGSRARGTHTLESDIDIGIYYHSDTLDLTVLDKAATVLDSEHGTGLIAPPGAWGNWVNGGGWLMINGCHVDFILRDILRVEQAIEDCREGRITAHYQTGHPHAYLNAMYMGELAICRILFDRDGKLQEMQNKTQPYPQNMREAIIRFFMFEAGFSHMFADKNKNKHDAYYVAAHLVRSVSCLNQVLFALNGEYCINEKKAVRMIDGFQVKPPEYGRRIENLFSLAGHEEEQACTCLKKLIDDVEKLVREV
ncbi:nucleotidyltransferase domain-containing protein [Sporomusa sphaeroides]|uniref:Nucleotidyltransferase domain protein n=1 Tax=Sporomusa sphaeroides DSM 2875 TaxID=1337886 RepID=A0ABP2C3D9_9FIRM|nr:nucleotidyltransferase domain-containing protein [Sporomusa sphaeroides]OLS55822.1 nucleotidyltransferase domain protein [Sporomusa sphaeroides DSM 2875]CVK18823.1 Nucleotidyltransferase domain protein [Sporomusa sphaeroides DSM 2875]